MDFKHEFKTRLGDGEVTFPMKVEAWAETLPEPFKFLMETFVVPWLKEFWVDIKTEKTMNEVDIQSAALVESWEQEEASEYEPILTITEDPEAPLGIKEMRLRSPWVDE